MISQRELRESVWHGSIIVFPALSNQRLRNPSFPDPLHRAEKGLLAPFAFQQGLDAVDLLRSQIEAIRNLYGGFLASQRQVDSRFHFLAPLLPSFRGLFDNLYFKINIGVAPKWNECLQVGGNR